MNENDGNKMEIDLHSLEKWSRQLPFNAKKCKVMHVGSKNPNREYKLNDMILDASDHEKDLGVIIDESLKFRTHAVAAIKKANQTNYQKVIHITGCSDNYSLYSYGLTPPPIW